jgi:hypothetical protein
MSQHDLNIANQGFPAFRADLNDALVALGSTNSGATAPATTYANQLWYDTANNILKIRNEDNDAWISIATLDQSADTVSAITAATVNAGALNATGVTTVQAGTSAAPAITTTGDANTGIFFPAADTIAFAEGGVEAMRINSSANVGIGTASPSTKLVVKGTHVGGEGLINIIADSGTQFAALSFTNNVTQKGIIFHDNTNNLFYLYGASGQGLAFNSNDAERMRIDTSGNVMIGANTIDSGYRLSVVGGGIIALKNESGTAFHTTNSVNADYSVITTSGGLTNVGTTGNVLAFTTGSERMRIDSSGGVYIGKTTSAANVVGTFISPTTSINTCRAASTNAASTLEVFSTGAGDYRFYLGMGGTIYATNTTITAISDVRLKENIQDIDVGLDAVMALKPRKFDWKEGKGKNKKGDRGWIAQEFEKVFPEMIDEWKQPAPECEEAYKAVNADLIPVLVKAIQELKAELDSVKAELQNIKGN